MSHFFAYLSRMRLIWRWGLMRNTQKENIQEHSLQVATVAHALALIRNAYHGGNVDAERVMALAMFHEVAEVFTGDLPTPIKYFNNEIKSLYDDIETQAKNKLCSMQPVVGSLLGAVLLGEVLTPAFFGGGALILAAVYLALEQKEAIKGDEV